MKKVSCEFRGEVFGFNPTAKSIGDFLLCTLYIDETFKRNFVEFPTRVFHDAVALSTNSGEDQGFLVRSMGVADGPSMHSIDPMALMLIPADRLGSFRLNLFVLPLPEMQRLAGFRRYLPYQQSVEFLQ